VLAYAITMLHSDAHSKLLKEHMSKATFIESNLQVVCLGEGEGSRCGVVLCGFGACNASPRVYLCWVRARAGVMAHCRA